MSPSSTVQHAAESFWRVDGGERPTADPVRVLPDGHMDLLVRFRRDRSEKPVVLVSGTAVAPAFAEIDPGVVYVGARFHAGVARFHRAVLLLRASESGDLARIAHEVGYADQAHLSRDVRAFSGLTPSALARGR